MKKSVITFLITVVIFPLTVLSQPEWVWAHDAGPQSLLIPRSPGFGADLIIDESHNIYVLGHYKQDTFNIQHLSLYNNSYQSIFLAKYDASGTVQWAKSINGVSPIFDDWAVGLAFTPNGNIVVAGNFRDTLVNTQPAPLIGNGNGDIFLAEFSPNGNMNWSKSFGSHLHGEFVEDIDVDPSGNIYITGSFFSQTLAFDAISLQKNAVKDFFIAKLDATANTIWAINADSTSGFNYGSGESIAVDSSGNIAVSGTFSSAQLGIQGVTVPNRGFNDVFVARLNTNGQLNWIHSAGGSKNEWGHAVDMDNQGNIYVGGTYASDTFNIDQTRLHLICGLGFLCNDMFLAKYDPIGNLLWARQTQSDIQNESSLADIEVDEFGNCYTTGNYDKDIHVDQFHLTSSNLNVNILTCKFNPKGMAIWVKASDGTQTDMGFGLAVGSDSAVYVTGRFRSPNMLLDSITLPNGSFSYNYFVGKIKPCNSAYGPVLKDSVIAVLRGDTVSLTPNPGFYSYCWSSGGSDLQLNIPTDTFSVNSHIIRIKASDINGCEFIDSIRIDVIPAPVGLSDSKLTDLVKVYPNPFNDHIVAETSLPLQWQLTDMSGSLIDSGKVTEGTSKISLEALPKGVYTLRMYSTVTSLAPVVKKLIKP